MSMSKQQAAWKPTELNALQVQIFLDTQNVGVIKSALRVSFQVNSHWMALTTNDVLSKN